MISKETTDEVTLEMLEWELEKDLIEFADIFGVAKAWKLVAKNLSMFDKHTRKDRENMKQDVEEALRWDLNHE